MYLENPIFENAERGLTGQENRSIINKSRG